MVVCKKRPESMREGGGRSMSLPGTWGNLNSEIAVSCCRTRGCSLGYGLALWHSLTAHLHPTTGGEALIYGVYTNFYSLFISPVHELSCEKWLSFSSRTVVLCVWGDLPSLVQIPFFSTKEHIWYKSNGISWDPEGVSIYWEGKTRCSGSFLAPYPHCWGALEWDIQGCCSTVVLKLFRKSCIIKTPGERRNEAPSTFVGKTVWLKIQLK